MRASPAGWFGLGEGTLQAWSRLDQHEAAGRRDLWCGMHPRTMSAQGGGRLQVTIRTTQTSHLDRVCVSSDNGSFGCASCALSCALSRSPFVTVTDVFIEVAHTPGCF